MADRIRVAPRHQHAWQNMSGILEPLQFEWCQLCGAFAYWSRERKKRRRVIDLPLYWRELVRRARKVQ